MGKRLSLAVEVAKKYHEGMTDIAGKPYSYIKSAGQGQIAAINAVSYLDQLKIKERNENK